MKIKFLIPLILSIGQIFAKDDFFTNDDRAEIFQKTDFVVPKITVNFSEEDYKNFFLKYQCEYDMHPRNAIRNDDCYKAPWVDLDYALSKAFRNNIINKNSITDSNDLNIIKKGNITLTNFENLVKKYTDLQLENVLTTTNGLIKIPDQIADEASMTFDINGDVHNVDRIKISVGGKYTKSFEKLGFNIKIKKGKLLGRKQLRLRSEAVDPSFLREKLAYDICNELGLPSLSANFVEVYFNKKFMGFYVMRDAFKSQWIEDLFGESGTKTLYTCDRNYGNNKFFNCINDDEDITDDATFKAFQDKLEQTKTKSELEQFFNVPLFLKWQALKYLFGSWDHITNAHNSYVYRDVRNKWHVFLYDFDSDLGAYKNPKTNRTFEKEIFDNNNPLFKDILKLHENENLVSEYIEQFMKKVFNPKKLIPRIDKLKKFIGPYVKNDRKRDEDGNLQGRIKRVNIKVEDYFTYDDFDKNSEFTNVQLRKYQSDKVFTDDYIYGLKSWIIERFEFACRKYKFDCSYASEYLSTPDYNHETVLLEETNGGCHNTGYMCCTGENPSVQTVDNVGKWSIEGTEWCLIDEEQRNCWSKKYGFPCCNEKKTKITSVEHEDGKEHLYGTENGSQCGITDYQLCRSGGQYKCCTGCKIEYTDTEDWGIENGEWCSIPNSCYESGLPTLTISVPVATTTTTTTTAPPTPEPTQCAASLDPCGGTEYPDAPSCCESGNFCFKYFSHVHQCVPDELKSELPTGNNVVTPKKTNQCAKAFQACGGTDNENAPNCCETGFACRRRNPKFYQCVPEKSLERK